MSRTSTILAAATAAAICLIGSAAGAQTPARDQPAQIAADQQPQPGGPHRDPPGIKSIAGCPQGWKPVPPGVNAALRCLPDHLVATMGAPTGTAAPPPGCPRGWKPVPPELNPVLRCQPDRILAARPAGQAPQPPIGCPAGWRPVPPEVNPLLRCLPDQIAAAPPPGPSQALRPGCPRGWKPVPQEVNSVMRCLPDQAVAPSVPQPQRTGPEPGEPVQAAAGDARR